MILHCAMDVGLADEQAFLSYCKFSVALHYLDCCGMTEGFILLGLYYFDSSRRPVFDVALGQISTQYVLCLVYVVCDGMYRAGRLKAVLDRIKR